MLLAACGSPTTETLFFSLVFACSLLATDFTALAVQLLVYFIDIKLFTAAGERLLEQSILHLIIDIFGLLCLYSF